jgi:putative transposase
MLTYSFRIFPTREQISILTDLSSLKDEIYNHFLELQQNEYKTTEDKISLYDMYNLIPVLKKQPKFAHWKKLHSKATQRVIAELEGSYKSFFKLIKKDKSARPPKRRETKPGFYTTISFNQSGWIIDKEKDIITINKISFKFASHLDIRSLKIKELKIKFRNQKWLVDICVEENLKKDKKQNQKTKILAIDLGLEKLATGIDSNGNVVILKNKAKKISKYYNKIINQIKSKQSKKTKYSRGWKHLQKRKKFFYNKKNAQVKQTLHIQSKQLLDMNYNTIIIGDLRVKQLMELERNKYNKVSRSFGNSNVSMFVDFLLYKAPGKNTNVVKLDERHTSQLNSLTGKLFAVKRELGDRVVELEPGLIIDRDLNSAINIYKRWESNQLAAMTPPLSKKLDDVFAKNNLYKKLVPNLTASAV